MLLTRQPPSLVPSRRLRGGLAVAFSLAAGPALADGAETVTRWYDELGAVDGVTVRHGAITDEAGGKTIARDVEVRFRTQFKAGITDLIDPITMTIEGSWSVPALMTTDLVDTADGYRAAAIEIPEQTVSLQLSVQGTPEPIRVTAAMTDMVMRDGAWPRLPEVAADPARPVSRFGPAVEAALRQSWAEQTVATAAFTLEAPGTRQVTRYGPARVSGYVDGRIAQMTTENSESTFTSTEPGATGAPPATTTGRGSVRRITDTGYDVLPLVRAFFGLPQAAPRAIVLESEVVEDVRSDSDGGRIAVARSATRGVSIGTPARPLAALYDRLVVDGTVAADDLVDTVLATVEVLGVAEVEMTDLSFDGLADAGGGAGLAAEGGVRELRMDGWNGFAVDGVSLGGLTGEVPGTGGLALQRFALSDIAWPSREAIVAAVRAGLAAETAAAARPKPEAAPDGGGPDIDGSDLDAVDPDTADAAAAPTLTTRQGLDLVPTLGGFEVAGLTVTRAGERVVGLESFRGVFENFVAPIPTDVRVDLAGLRIPAKFVDDADLSDALARFGITTLDVDARLALAWDEASGAYALDPFEVAVAGMGTHTSRVRLGNVPRSVFADPENAQAALPQITFEGAETSLADAPALSTYIASLARDAGVSTADLIEGFAEQARETLAAQAGDAFADQAATAVRGFLNDPAGALIVRAAPKQPVPLAALMGSAVMAPGSIIGLLNVTIEAGRRL